MCVTGALKHSDDTSAFRKSSEIFNSEQPHKKGSQFFFVTRGHATACSILDLSFCYHTFFYHMVVLYQSVMLTSLQPITNNK